MNHTRLRSFNLQEFDSIVHFLFELAYKMLFPITVVGKIQALEKPEAEEQTVLIRNGYWWRSRLYERICKDGSKT